MNAEEKQIDINRIMELIPHRYPFLLIDRIVELEPDEYAVALKNVTINEPHFMGHFPGQPVMPGVLIVEAMAQASVALVYETLGGEAEGRIAYFMSVENARFRRPVVPGDSLYIRVRKIQQRRNAWKFKGEATVNDKLVAEATYSAMIMNE
jgi:3-hydroxyacyl-[acyl-carrier-protein] dehydratase